MHRKALGRGLEALIPGPPQAAVAPIAPQGPGQTEVAIEDVAPNPHQPRIKFEDDAIRELAASIRTSGVIQPIIVRRLASNEGFELVAGERRLRAAKLAGLDRIPAIVRKVTDREMLEVALVENIQREDLNPIEEAKAYKSLGESAELTHEEISERVGKQRVSVTNSLRLLTLPPEVQDMVSRGTLSAGHARALLGLPNGGEQLGAARYVAAKGFSVRRTEAFVQRRIRRHGTRPSRPRTSGLVEWETKLQQRFATQVMITRGRKGGAVRFEFYGDDDLERLLEAWGVV